MCRGLLAARRDRILPDPRRRRSRAHPARGTPGIFLALRSSVTPRLSVVIVVSDPRQPLGRCLDALEQCRTRVPLEAIVVDHGPGGGCAGPLRERFPWIEVVGPPERRGFTFGVNRGFALARAEAVLMLSPDCKVTAEALERLLRALACEPALAAVAPALPDRYGMPARSCGRFPDLWTLLCGELGLARALPDSALFGRYRYGGRRLETLDYVDWASGAALLIPRGLWRRLGGLDENLLVSMEEVDWCRRAATAGHRVRYAPAAAVTHLGREAARATPDETYLQHLRSRLYYFRKHHGTWTAHGARALLTLSLAARWLGALASHLLRPAGAGGERGAPAPASLYAAGLGVVWAEAGR